MTEQPYPLAFLIMAHKGPELVRRISERLFPYPIYLHVDRRASEQVWRQFSALSHSSPIRLLKRHRSGWASWGYVEALLEGLRAAVADGQKHIVVMTGQDYPLHPVEHIADFFEAAPGISWLYQTPVPVTTGRIGDPDGGMGRFQKVCLTVRGRHLRIPARRAMPLGLGRYYGQVQCCLAGPLAAHIVGQVDSHPELSRYFRWTQAPDELLIPSLAMSSALSGDVEGDNLWYADWSAGGAHPKILVAADYWRIAQEAAQGGRTGGPGRIKLFARKVDPSLSAALLDQIDSELLNR